MPEFPKLPDAERLGRLRPPAGRVRMVLDTDTANEIDDQFAVVHALISGERLGLEAIYATQFSRGERGPAEGVAESEEEILRLLDRLGVDPAGRVLRGADRALASAEEPAANAASADLAERALATAAGEVLWVAAIGALTNVASALLMEPSIVERIAVVWLGGQARHAHSAAEYNLSGDPAAARAVFGSGVPLVHVPCYGAASHLLTTTAELDRFVRPHGAIGEYLAEIFAGHRRFEGERELGRSKEVWDLAATGYLADPESVPLNIVRAPGLSEELTWEEREDADQMAEARYVDRDLIFGDLFGKLAELAAGKRTAGWSGT